MIKCGLKKIMEFVRVTGNTFSNPLLLVLVQATYQFKGAHFSQIGNLGSFVETVFADEDFPLILCM